MKVLFNADDFGLTKGVTDGIIQSYENGVVRSTTLMMNGSAVRYAVEQARVHPNLHVGIHLVLSYGSPLSTDVPSLVTEKGSFRFTNAYREMEPPTVEDVEKEWRAQLDAFLATGLPLHHIDSHHHVHGWEILSDLVVRLANEYQVPVRFTESLRSYPEILLTDTLWLDFYEDGVSMDLFDHMSTLKCETVEVMTHPAIVDPELRASSSYLEKREEELAILCSLQVPTWVELME